MMNTFAGLFNVFDAGNISAPYADLPAAPCWGAPLPLPLPLPCGDLFPDDLPDHDDHQQQQSLPLPPGCCPAPAPVAAGPPSSYGHPCTPSSGLSAYTAGGLPAPAEASGVSAATSDSRRTLNPNPTWGDLGDLDTGNSNSDDLGETADGGEVLGESWFVTLKSAGVRIKGRSRTELLQVAEKIRKRRRESAARSRARKASKLSTLNDENNALRQENEALRRKVEELTAARSAEATPW